MTKKYNESMAALEIQKKKKEEVLAKKRELEEQLNIVRKQKDEQQEELNKMEKKVKAAENLLDSLKGEKGRWTEQSKQFDTEKKQLLGNCAICSAFIAYAGPFNYTYREEVLLKKLFFEDVKKKDIPYYEKLDIQEFLVDEQKKNDWLMAKLPNDELSIQNAILVTNSSRYPLLIDPQEQAKSWLTNMYPGLLDKHIFQMSVFCGKQFATYCDLFLQEDTQIMLEGIENEVDTSLDPILTKEFQPSKQPNPRMRKIKIGDQEVNFNPKFQLFLLCKLINPHFTPELAAKTTIIDFCVTAIGLEQQLQALVISKEQKALEETLKNILSDITKNKKSLVKCQKDILDNLNKEGNLLENEEIVLVLNNSKTQAEDNK